MLHQFFVICPFTFFSFLRISLPVVRSFESHLNPYGLGARLYFLWGKVLAPDTLNMHFFLDLLN